VFVPERAVSVSKLVFHTFLLLVIIDQLVVFVGRIVRFPISTHVMANIWVAMYLAEIYQSNKYLKNRANALPVSDKTYPVPNHAM